MVTPYRRWAGTEIQHSLATCHLPVAIADRAKPARRAAGSRRKRGGSALAGRVHALGLDSGQHPHLAWSCIRVLVAAQVLLRHAVDVLARILARRLHDATANHDRVIRVVG